MIDLGEWVGIVDTDISPWWVVIRKSEIKSFYPVNNKCDEVCINTDKGSSYIMMEFQDRL